MKKNAIIVLMSASCALASNYWDTIPCDQLTDQLKKDLKKPYDTSRDFPLLTYVQCPALLKQVIDTIIDSNNPIHQGLLKRALRHAVIIDNVQSAQLLLEYGVPADAQSGAPINYAASYEMVQLLVKHGAKVNRTEGFSTPLYWALDGRHVHAIRALLELGADPKEVSRKGTKLSLRELLIKAEQEAIGIGDYQDSDKLGEIAQLLDELKI